MIKEIKFNNKQKALIHKLQKKALALNGSIGFDRDDNTHGLLMITVNKIPDSVLALDSDCIASIDLLPDSNKRYTFSVNAYNDIIDTERDDLDQIKKLQCLAVKYAIKLFKANN